MLMIFHMREEESEMDKFPSSGYWSFPAHACLQCRATRRRPEIPKLISSMPPT
jgi:hypothetical protein